ncbi:MAG: M23 family metallopeptidase [Treponema sp.]|jgi:hypothetical protein|nr:M23 family metallopeptidase [Treponema sp.]
MKGFGKGCTLAFFLILLIPPPCSALNGPDVSGLGLNGGGEFPRIGRLDGRDTLFKQYMSDVETNRKRIFNREKNRESPRILAESLTIYQYIPAKGEDIFSLAARCNMPYTALASLNRLGHSSLLEAGKPFLLPSSPGLFIPAEPRSDLEHLLTSSLSSLPEAEEAAALTIALDEQDRGTVFYFYPGLEFGPTERAFFLNAGFRFPLRLFRRTSAYGIRRNPVTGNIRLHQGIDLAAPLGTDVYASGEGIVTEIGEDSIYGIYIIIKHGESWASLYGHLQKVETTLRSLVRSGTLIGRVGSTGQSTGPHLHFELRQNGKAQDPDKYLFMPGGG